MSHRVHTAGGQVVEISNSTNWARGESDQGQAAKIRIGSGIGTATGAIREGGKGAAAGAGAGTGVALAMRGDPAVIPSETVLNFKAQGPGHRRRVDVEDG